MNQESSILLSLDDEQIIIQTFSLLGGHKLSVPSTAGSGPLARKRLHFILNKKVI